MAERTTSVTPAAAFVGRARELAELAGTLETARTGKGQILFVIGDAGRGKTALVQEFTRRAQREDVALLAVSGHCNAHTGIGDPYLPFREMLSTLAEIYSWFTEGFDTGDLLEAKALLEALRGT